VTDVGEIWLADLNEERRRRVLVLSNRRFNELSGRALVAPDLGDATSAAAATVTFPWRIEADGGIFAVDHLGSLPSSRLLERVGHAPSDAVHAAATALRLVT
jgi:mRNA-degrading endonuclease toxin of MazEF toxin-antitoxin module